MKELYTMTLIYLVAFAYLSISSMIFMHNVNKNVDKLVAKIDYKIAMGNIDIAYEYTKRKPLPTKKSTIARAVGLIEKASKGLDNSKP